MHFICISYANSKTRTRVRFLWTAPNTKHIGCVFYESLHQAVYLVLACVSSESLPVFLPRMEWPTIQSRLHICEHSSPVSLHNTSNNEFLDWGWWWWLPRSRLWSQQDPKFNNNFSVLDKRDFKSMRDVRKYAPNQTVNWPRCAHDEFCAMQVYQGWDNSCRRFWHCSRANSMTSVLQHFMIY
jgi:hypothetical protein